MLGYVIQVLVASGTPKLKFVCRVPYRVCECWTQVGTGAAHYKQLAEPASSMSSCGAGAGAPIARGQRVQGVDLSRCCRAVTEACIRLL